ncbi:MAG TPA: CopG family transcriptional regulator [Actinomycetota bacterium]
MRRTTVMLSEEVDDLLRHEAERLGVTVSQLTREAIETHLGIRPRRKFLSAGAGSSGDPDLTSKIDEILAEGFGR